MMLLSVYDTMYVLISFLLFAVPVMSKDWHAGMHAIVFPKVYPLAQIALTGSVYSIVAITVERYLIVCHPFFTVQVRW